MSERQDFEDRVMPHLDAAYNLARWLLRSEQNAEDAVQEAVIRALRYGHSLRDGDAKPWLLGIVRNTCFNVLARARNGPELVEFDDEAFQAQIGQQAASDHDNPERVLQRQRTRVRVDAAIRALSPGLREVIVLREFEDLSYEDMARIIGIPVGTVMSRLSRARDKLRQALPADSQGQ
jgi:RNA polymerase sigma factor (sigma-70 family)